MKQDTIEHVLEIGTNLILKRGYNSVGLNTILKEANIPKGSFYYYFKNKEDFGIQMIKYYSKNAIKILESYLQDYDKQPKERIITFFEDMKNIYAEKQFTEGCLLGNCSLELSDISNSFSRVISNEMDNWGKSFENCILEGQKNGTIKKEKTAKEISDFILLGWEGALLRMKSAKNDKPISIFIDFVNTYIL